jgi:hypothetical protein
MKVCTTFPNPEQYARVLSEESCSFFDAGTVTGSSVVDGVHLDSEQHAGLGRRLAEVMRPLFHTRQAKPADNLASQ